MILIVQKVINYLSISMASLDTEKKKLYLFSVYYI